MKVRLTADMLRLRLDQPDVDALSSSGAIGFSLPLGADTSLRCTLRMETEASAIDATFTDGEMVVTLPAERAKRWMTSEAVSLEGQTGAGGTSTRILVEKDLGCRHGEDASESAASATFDHLRE